MFWDGAFNSLAMVLITLIFWSNTCEKTNKTTATTSVILDEKKLIEIGSGVYMLGSKAQANPEISTTPLYVVWIILVFKGILTWMSERELLVYK